MVVDTSVLLHIAFAESGWEESASILIARNARLVAAPSLVEATAVLAGRVTGNPKKVIGDLLYELRADVVPFSEAQARLAQDAYIRYGKGQGNKAQLNLGDVMSYALAKERKERLAFSGDDFLYTDLDVLRLPLTVTS